MTAPTRTGRRPPAAASGPSARRRRRQAGWLRLGLLGAAATGAFVAGLVVGASGEDPRRETAQRFVDAWARGDYTQMHAQLRAEDQEAISVQDFAATYREAAGVSTFERIVPGRAEDPAGGRVVVPMRMDTRVFGALTTPLTLPVEETDTGAEIAWSANLVQPGLRPGEKLRRRTRMPARAAIQARDGTPLAEGEARLSELGALASEIAGRVGPAPPERAAELERRGVPAGAPVGVTGLEREFDEQLAGTPGGKLLAGDRVLAEAAPEKGSAVRTTIDPEVQRAAVEALAGRFGGIAVMRPRDGEVLALAGIAYSAPQPPGSVFKIITLTAGLEAGVAKPSNEYPVETAAVLEGVELENANGESCGGSLETAFAHSCNSVFAPMGAEVGAQKLVATAERFGFNADPGLAGAMRSTIPGAAEIGDDLAVGSTAIGQGKVLATPLEFAKIAGAIGERGVMAQPTLRKGDDPATKRVVPEDIARTVNRYMRAVVTDGTGVAAQIPDVKVAGKTGTAELRDTTNEDPVPEDGAPVDDTTDTNAWFAAYAPAGKPRVAVAVMLVGQGAGGETAAPAARIVLEAALKR